MSIISFISIFDLLTNECVSMGGFFTSSLSASTFFDGCLGGVLGQCSGSCLKNSGPSNHSWLLTSPSPVNPLVGKSAEFISP